MQLDLETEGFSYRKWGGIQHCKPGDWIVNDRGNVYTIDQRSFAATYEETGLGQYRKTAVVWAEVATEAGAVATREGTTAYEAGDYLVSNDEAGKDSYAVRRSKFLAMYEPAGNED